jgi:5-methylcytosine-specific restriction endonuclease McrA
VIDDFEFLAIRDCLVPRVAELDVAVDAIEQAADAVLHGEIGQARHLLQKANIPILRELAIRAMGPLDRDIHRLRPVPLPPKTAKPDLRMPGKRVAEQVFARDGWHCRFCGVRVVVPAARKVLEASVPDALCWQGENKDLHAAFLYISATLDHVVPHSRGGTNDMDNLVAACWPCNFGRGGYLLEQMGLNDPRQRPPVRDGWDGLTRLLHGPVLRPAARDRVPQSTQPRPARKPSLSVSDWLQQLECIDEDASDRMLAFVASCEGLSVSWSAREVLLLKLTSGAQTLDVCGFERNGAVQIPWHIGEAKAAFRPFAETIASVIPGAVAYETPKTWTVRHASKRTICIDEILEVTKVLRDALVQLQADLGEVEAQ